jgi:phosphoenolpyruvate carboxylase
VLKAGDRYIPRTMATQHPDNASVPHWHHSAMVTAAEEVKESLVAWKEFGCEEVKWDWEGKLVEESVLERLFMTEAEYLAQRPLGSSHFLTFRIPHPHKEKGGRYWRALTSIVTAQRLAEQLDLEHPLLAEVILPMTTNAQELIAVHKDLQELADFYAPKFGGLSQLNPTAFRIIPLVETVEALSNYDHIIKEYCEWYYHHYHEKLVSFRPYIARSDPALQSGLLAAVLVSKLALSKIHRQGSKDGIEMYPIVGMGSLPFRGGLSPSTVDEMVKEYQGVATFTIQSAFRYDYAKELAQESIDKINQTTFSSSKVLVKEESDFLKAATVIASSCYQKALAPLLPLFPLLSPLVPKRRERFSSQNALFSYDRKSQGVSLPRAITFTAVLYSLGLPPELLGMGRALREILSLPKGPQMLEYFYPSLLSHVRAAGVYLNKSGLSELEKKFPELSAVIEDLTLTEKLLGVKFGSTTEAEHWHSQLSSQVIKQLFSSVHSDIPALIQEAASIRKSIG